MKMKISVEALDLLTNEFRACTFPQLTVTTREEYKYP